MAGSVTLISLTIGSVAAYALGRFRFRGKSPVLYLMLSMTIFPQIAILGALYTMFSGFHIIGPIDFPKLYDTEWALIFSYLIFTLPFTIWVLTGFMRALPADLEEAAYVDGATPLQVFYKVLLPLIAPGLVTTGLLAFIAAWNEYLFAPSFIQSPSKYTGAGRDHVLHRRKRQRLPDTVGAADGRDGGRHRAADRGHLAAAETDPGRPHRRRRQGLDRRARLPGRRSRAGSCRRRARSRCPRRSATSG